MSNTVMPAAKPLFVTSRAVILQKQDDQSSPLSDSDKARYRTRRAAIAIHTATVAASAAASIAASTQPKDEVTFEYHLSDVAGNEFLSLDLRSRLQL